MYSPEKLQNFERQPDIETEAEQHPLLNYYLHLPYHFVTDDDKKTTRLKASYFGLMTEVDDNLGRLFEFLKKVFQG